MGGIFLLVVFSVHFSLQALCKGLFHFGCTAIQMVPVVVCWDRAGAGDYCMVRVGNTH